MGSMSQSLKPRPGRVTADEAIGRRDEESLGSVRQRLATLPRERWILLGILGLVVVVHGWRAVRPFFIGGDLLYHWGLTHTILLGHVPAGGPVHRPAGLLPAGLPPHPRRSRVDPRP